MKLRFRISPGLVLTGLLLMLLLGACNYPTQRQPTSTPDILPTLVATLLATPAPAATEAAPMRLLTVCLGEEPASLFPYGDSSLAAQAVRDAIYDGAVDWVNYAPQPGILAKIPSVADGDVKLEPVEVSPGDLIIDVDGKLTTLQAGSAYLPAGCQEAGCAAAYAGTETVQMDQLAVQFTLRDGLLWSDGSPLSAKDSLYSYDVAQQLFPGARADLLRATSSYQAKDELSVEWRGVPGYRDPTYAANFFMPLPQHAWGSLPAEELATAEISAKMPVGWGAYQIEEWKAGDHITLRKNENYFRSADGLPAFDRLVYRFVKPSQEGLAALLAGECDVLDVSALEDLNTAELSGLQEAGRIRIVTQPDTAWDQLLFGIQPLDTAQPAFFQTKEVRQAIAQCIDRQSLISGLGMAQEQGMNTYVPSSHPLYSPDSRQYIYDPQAGAAGLQAAGWLDPDNDPATPRVSQGASGAPDGTPFVVELLSLQDNPRKQSAAAIKENLAQCGVLVNIRSLTPEELFAPGPDGPVFGRNFQLAQFGWDLALEPACTLYTSEEIPGPPPGAYKGWGGANAGGFSSPEFDRACGLAYSSLPDDPRHAVAHRQTQAIFAEELPALPLYTHSQMVVTRPDLCGLRLDGSSGSILWNLEGLNYGEDCQAE